ncbi:MAG TPA: hypothetical protein VK800_08950 [Steroidobacteraceae bacterium]|jgi:hypothetical protein|nr:hypothetical protein [Steroidobacteraceae bacterium]
MNTFAATFYRASTCAAAAVLITLISGFAFVQSTSLPPGVHAATPVVAATMPHWFGQPQPAVLVD